MKKKTKFIALITLITVVTTLCMVTINSSYSWYLTENTIEEDLVIRADGFTYINLEVPTDSLSEGSDRYIAPAKALPHAVDQGLYLDVTKTYEETKNSSNPSYILTPAVQKTFVTKVSMFQAEGQKSMVNYDIWAIADNIDGAKVYGKNELVFSDVSFYYYDTKVEKDDEGNDVLDENGNVIEVSEYVNPLKNNQGCSQTSDKTSGVLCITGSQNIYITITLYFANVDELIDDEFYKHDSFWLTLAFSIRQ